MTDLLNESLEYRRKLDKANSRFNKLGEDRAKAENEYRVELAKAMLIERENGIPATILSDICRGKKEIAMLKMKRDIADSMYEACREFINSTKLQLKLIDNQMEREWHS